MKTQKTIGYLSKILLLLLISAIFCTSAAAKAELEKIFEIPTSAKDGWAVAEGTVISSETVKSSDSAAISFTSSSQLIGAEYRFENTGDLFGKDSLSPVLIIRLFISDTSALKGEKGTISFLCDDGFGFSWSVNDLTLKNGWNDLTLNFRTADTVMPQKPVSEETEDSEEDTEETEETEEEPAETEPETVKTADEILAELTVFSFSLEKSPVKDTTVAFSEISVNTHGKQEEPKAPEPLKDNLTAPALIVSLAVAAAITAAVLIFSAAYAKKEIKRRKREAKKRRAEQQTND